MSGCYIDSLSLLLLGGGGAQKERLLAELNAQIDRGGRLVTSFHSLSVMVEAFRRAGAHGELRLQLSRIERLCEEILRPDGDDFELALDLLEPYSLSMQRATEAALCLNRRALLLSPSADLDGISGIVRLPL